MALFPVLLLILLEGGLRLVWTPEESRGLFIPDAFNENYYSVNQSVGKLYFSGSTFAAFGTQDGFRKKKPENGLRIFVLGGSTTAGYPTLYSGSFPAMLRSRLQVQYPDRTVEVINLGMTAVNTFTVRDFALEAMNYDPDALVIYAGHNEFYGALGTGSSQRPFWGMNRGLTLFYLHLKKLRLYRLWSTLLNQWQSKSASRAPSQTLMAKMAQEQTIALDSPLYDKTVAIFRQNLDDILRRAEKDSLPVFIGTLVSNLKDQPPFISIPPEGESETVILQHIRTRLNGQTLETRSAVLDSFKRRYPGFARVYYLSGRIKHALGDYPSAGADFKRAKDLDGLRFRAPSDFNTVIQDLGASRRNTIVVPVDSFFSAASPHGLVGNNLIWEHLHPNLDGYFLMAKSFASSINAVIPPENAPCNEDSLYGTIAVSTLDSAMARYRLEILMAGWPFHPESQFKSVRDLAPETFEDSLAVAVLTKQLNYEKAHVIAALRYTKTGRWRRAVKEYRVLAETFPHNESPWLALGRIYIQHRRFEEALPVLKTALSLTDDGFTAKWVGTILLQKGKSRQALAYLKDARRRLPKDPQLLYNLSGAYFFNGDTAQAIATIEAALKIAPGDTAARNFHRKLMAATSRP